MLKQTRIILTNNLAIFIITGIIYVFMEVFATSIPAPSMIEKYQFNPIITTTYEKMTFKPPSEKIIGDLVYLQPIQRLSWIGASSIWMFLVGGLSGLCLYLLYNALKKKWNLFFLCLVGTLIITILELISGVLLNGVLKLFIWDYTTKFLNLWGQICLSHCIIYFLVICPFGYWLFHFIEAQYTKQKILHLFAQYSKLFNPFAENLASVQTYTADKTGPGNNFT